MSRTCRHCGANLSAFGSRAGLCSSCAYEEESQRRESELANREALRQQQQAITASIGLASAQTRLAVEQVREEQQGMIAEMERRTQLLHAQQRLTEAERHIFEQNEKLRLRLSDLGLLAKTDQEAAVRQLEILLGAGDLQRDEALAKQLVENLGLRPAYLEAAARFLSRATPKQVEHGLDWAIENDRLLYDFIMGHAGFRWREDFQHFFHHERDYPGRKRKAEEEARKVAERRKREAELQRVEEEARKIREAKAQELAEQKRLRGERRRDFFVQFWAVAARFGACFAGLAVAIFVPLAATDPFRLWEKLFLHVVPSILAVWIPWGEGHRYTDKKINVGLMDRWEPGSTRRFLLRFWIYLLMMRGVIAFFPGVFHSLLDNFVITGGVVYRQFFGP